MIREKEGMGQEVMGGTHNLPNAIIWIHVVGSLRIQLMLNKKKKQIKLKTFFTENRAIFTVVLISENSSSDSY